MSAKWTPGPWQMREGTAGFNVTTVGAPRTFNICRINTDREEQEANARLIAAAPELLVALKATARWNADGLCWCDLERKVAAIKGTKIHSNPCKLARAAIAKIEGGAA